MRNPTHPSPLREFLILAMLWLWFVWCDYEHVIVPVLAVIAAGAAVWGYAFVCHLMESTE